MGGGTLAAERLAVLAIVVPAAADRRAVRLEQDAEAPAHEAVEPLHHEPRVRVREFGECRVGTEEVPVGTDLDAERRQIGPHPPVAGVEHDQPLGPQRLGPPPDLAGERAAVLGIVELDIVDAPAARARLVAEVAHGGEEEGKPAFVLRDSGRLLAHLHLQDRVPRGVEAVEGGGGRVELIAEDDHEVARRRMRQPRLRYQGTGRHLARAGAPSSAGGG